MVHLNAQASTSAVSLDQLSSSELKDIKANILTEHFGWAPESFAKQGMDLANVAMYAATEAVEKILMEKVGMPHVEGEVALDEDEIQKGIYRLETLLESAIDKHFDLFEIYVLRNTFALKTGLIPYMALTHQESLDENLRGKDGEALEEYERELHLYEEELRKERELACADEFVKRKLDSVQELAEEVGYMRGADPLSSRTQGLVSQLSLLQERLATLLATPAPPARRATTDLADPWAASRASFVNWAAASKVDALPAAARDPTAAGTEDAVIKQMAETMYATGRDDDAQTLLASLTGP